MQALETSAKQFAVYHYSIGEPRTATAAVHQPPVRHGSLPLPYPPAPTYSGAGFVVRNGVCYDANADPALTPHDDERDKAARRGIRWAGFVLAIGIVLEVASSVWTFQKALSAGAFLDGVDCTLRASVVMQETCERLIAAEGSMFRIDTGTNATYNFFTFESDTYITVRVEGYENFSFANTENFLPCVDVDTTAAGNSSDLAGCNCDDNPNLPTNCWWFPAYNLPDDDIFYSSATVLDDASCLAVVLDVEIPNNDTDYTSFDVHPFNYGDVCRATTPSGTFALSVTGLVVALGSQLIEAVVGFKYMVDPRRPPDLMTAGTVFEALGVAAVAVVIVSLPGFFDDEFFGLEKTQRELVSAFTWVGAAAAIVGAFTEWSGSHPDRWGQRRPRLSVLGNALVWLGAAALEVVIAAFQTWRVTLSSGWGVLASELAGLVAVEVSGLLAMWLARVLWTRAREMLSPLLSDAGAALTRRKQAGRAGGQ